MNQDHRASEDAEHCTLSEAFDAWEGGKTFADLQDFVKGARDLPAWKLNVMSVEETRDLAWDIFERENGEVD